MAYNGWVNWHTWNVALWLDNDYGLYMSYRETVKALGNKVTPQEAEDIVWDLMPDGTPDFSRGAKEYKDVDWQEIADHMNTEDT